MMLYIVGIAVFVWGFRWAYKDRLKEIETHEEVQHKLAATEEQFRKDFPT
jgi:hypothetical protein